MFALLLTFQIKFWDILWSYIVTYLTDLEEHVTEYSWIQAKGLKVFGVKVINTFSAFVYCSYFQPIYYPQTCGRIIQESPLVTSPICYELLEENLTIVFVT